MLLSALWIIHGKGGEPPRSLRVPSLEVFLSCSEIWEVLGPSCPHVHLQWASRVCLASDCSPSKDGRGPWMQLGSPRGEEVGTHDHQVLRWGKGFWLTMEKTILFKTKSFLKPSTLKKLRPFKLKSLSACRAHTVCIPLWRVQPRGRNPCPHQWHACLPPLGPKRLFRPPFPPMHRRGCHPGQDGVLWPWVLAGSPFS